MRVAYREEPCRSALNRVKGMPFDWSLNPYTGCAHRCTFCYVRAFEARADRPSDDRYGRSIRVKVNVAEVLRRELARPSWKRDTVAVGAATDPYQPAERKLRVTRSILEVLQRHRHPVTIVTKSALIERDLDILVDAGLHDYEVEAIASDYDEDSVNLLEKVATRIGFGQQFTRTVASFD